MKTENDEVLASEYFCPSLNDEYSKKYTRLIKRMSVSLPANRIEMINKEICKTQDEKSEYLNDIDCLKYLSTLRVLIDLMNQGWHLTLDNGKVLLKLDNGDLNDKEHIRYRLSIERNAQFVIPSVLDFIKRMEQPKKYNGEVISIANLIGDKNELIRFIENNEKVCEPYIQLVSEEKDIHTGYYLNEIWRYFRYTWSIPYKTTPGRNMFYLVRDKKQKYHPIIGIFALGNSVLNLTVRDDDIGWTLESIQKQLRIKKDVSYCEQTVKGTDDRKVVTKITSNCESDKEYKKRINNYADKIMPLLEKSIKEAIKEIYVADLGYSRQTKKPKREFIDKLNQQAEKLAKKSLNNKNNNKNPDWKKEAQTILFKRKRCSELAKLLQAQLTILETSGTNLEKLEALISSDSGKKAINVALLSNRKRKIGSNMMDIIVCGSIPPYNELLGGKLISVLACSPTVIRDYTLRYEKQVSEIASRMKGSKVIRDSSLVFLGTTSLYYVGSSQYNRIKVPTSKNTSIEFRKMGITEGFGTVYFSDNTTFFLSRVLELRDGGKKINHVFGEGTSPRFRLISQGLKEIGIKAPSFLNHYCPRIVYSINISKNTNNFLLGLDNKAEYYFKIDNQKDVTKKTNELIDYWYNRWLKMRLDSVDIKSRLDEFCANDLLVSKNR